MIHFFKLLDIVKKWFFIVLLIFWLSETWYFGWNLKALSDKERYCDTIVIHGVDIWFEYFIAIIIFKVCYFIYCIIQASKDIF